MISVELSQLLEQYRVLDLTQQSFLTGVTDTSHPDKIEDAEFVARTNIMLEQLTTHSTNNDIVWAHSFCSDSISAATLVLALDRLKFVLSNSKANSLEQKWRALRNSSLR